MPLTVAETIMYSTLQVQIVDENNKTTGHATGFLVSFNVSKNEYVPALITNRHVVNSSNDIFVHFTRKKPTGDPDTGNVLPVHISTNSAIVHPNPDIDLAIIPLATLVKRLRELGTPIFCPFISDKFIPSDNTWSNFDALERVIMVGYPKGLRDKKNNLPIFRSGYTATHPGFDFNGKPEFLVDLPSYKGCSGSPVYLLGNNIYAKSQTVGKPIGTDRFYILGVMCALPAIEDTGRLDGGSNDSSKLKPIMPLHLDLGYIVKSSELRAFRTIIDDLAADGHTLTNSAP